MSIKIISLYIFMYFDVRDSGDDKTRFNRDSFQLSVITVYTIISFPSLHDVVDAVSTRIL